MHDLLEPFAELAFAPHGVEGREHHGSEDAYGRDRVPSSLPSAGLQLQVPLQCQPYVVCSVWCRQMGLRAGTGQLRRERDAEPDGGRGGTDLGVRGVELVVNILLATSWRCLQKTTRSALGGSSVVHAALHTTTLESQSSRTQTLWPRRRFQYLTISEESGARCGKDGHSSVLLREVP